MHGGCRPSLSARTASDLKSSHRLHRVAVGDAKSSPHSRVRCIARLLQCFGEAAMSLAVTATRAIARVVAQQRGVIVERRRDVG